MIFGSKSSSTKDGRIQNYMHTQGGPLLVTNGFIIPINGRKFIETGVVSNPISGVMGPYIELVGAHLVENAPQWKLGGIID